MADSTIITSQYVQIDQTPASIGERILARVIDIILITIYFFAALMVIGTTETGTKLLGDNGLNIFLIILTLPVFFYSVLWEVFNQGQSPGKKILGIRVVMKDGTTPGLNAYLLRWLLLLVDLHITQFVGIICIALTKNNQRIGDLAAGTLVIKEKNFRKINVTLDEFRHLNTDYRPVFPQAENLSLEQVNLINQTLFRYDADRPQHVHELGVKVREFLHINPPVNNEALLQTLIRDYQYYALEEI
ncbi:MAG: RDD family protein [Tannerella sp.]|jgi:uncharacterized RDD family membrane protein YckC|nr:RDD family protein [Tannerella sp.]